MERKMKNLLVGLVLLSTFDAFAETSGKKITITTPSLSNTGLRGSTCGREAALAGMLRNITDYWSMKGMEVLIGPWTDSPGEPESSPSQYYGNLLDNAYTDIDYTVLYWGQVTESFNNCGASPARGTFTSFRVYKGNPAVKKQLIGVFNCVPAPGRKIFQSWDVRLSQQTDEMTNCAVKNVDQIIDNYEHSMK